MWAFVTGFREGMQWGLSLCFIVRGWNHEMATNKSLQRRVEHIYTLLQCLQQRAWPNWSHFSQAKAGLEGHWKSMQLLRIPTLKEIHIRSREWQRGKKSGKHDGCSFLSHICLWCWSPIHNRICSSKKEGGLEHKKDGHPISIFILQNHFHPIILLNLLGHQLPLSFITVRVKQVWFGNFHSSCSVRRLYLLSGGNVITLQYVNHVISDTS